MTSHAVGDVVEARITKVLPFGALVELGDGVSGLLTGADPANLHVGAHVSARISTIDAERQRTALVTA